MIAAGGLCIGAFGLIMMAGADYTAQYQIDTKAVTLTAEYTKAMLTNSIFWHWVKFAIGGAGVMVLGIFMWSLEPIGGYYIHFEEDSNEH